MTISHGRWTVLRARFELVPGAELASESDRRTLTPEKAAAIGRLGFTRACDAVVDTAAPGAAFGRRPDWCAGELARLEGLAEDGLVRLHGGRIELTAAGRGLSRAVAAVFDRYLAASEVRHSLAV